MTVSSSGEGREDNPDNKPISLDKFVQTRDKAGTRSLGRSTQQQKTAVTVLDPGIQETQVGVEVQRERARTRLSVGLLGLLTARACFKTES